VNIYAHSPQSAMPAGIVPRYSPGALRLRARSFRRHPTWRLYLKMKTVSI
jgi:hypothetical protein